MKRDSQSNIQNLKPKIEWLDYGLLLALILPIFTVMPLLTHTGLPNTADGPVHLMRQVELNQAWQEGNFYPRWGADLALGHGMPIFSYAPPLLYQLTQLFHLFGLPLDEAMKAVLIVDFLLYSLGMFLFARRIFGVVPALLAATVYVYVPYRLREAYIQGNYGQFTGLAFYPLLFWAFHGLITDGRPRYLIVGALSLAGLLLSHNISSMLLAPIFAAYLVFLLILTIFEKSQQSSRPSSIKHIAANDETAPDNLRVVRRHPTPGSEDAATPHRDRGEEASDAKSDFHLSSYFASRLARTVAAILLGLGLAAIFWLPAFGERHQIKLEGITRGFFDFRENFISLSEFLAPPLPLDLTAINPEFPLSLGLPQLLAAGLGIFSLLLLIIIRSTFLGAARNPHRASLILFSTSSRGNSRSPMLHSLFFTFFLLLYSFLAVPQSQAIWEAVPLLELAEFPWRMLGPAIFCASILAAFLFLVVSNHRSIVMSRLFLVMAILITIGLNAYYLYPSQFIPWGTPTPADAFAYEAASGAIGTTSTGEFLPRSAQVHPDSDTLGPDYDAGRTPQKIDPSTLPAGATVEVISHRAESDVVQIDTPHEFVATARTLYWPGWQVYLDGELVAFTVTEDTGLIQATIPAGQHTLTLQLESTPLRTIGQWLTILSIVVLVVSAFVAAIRGGEGVESAISAAETVLDTRDERQRSSVVAGNNVISPRFFASGATLLVAVYLLSRPLAPIFTLRSNPDQPQPADRTLQVNFDDQIRLVGVDNLPEIIEISPPSSINLETTLYWRAQQKLDTNYSVFVHLDAPNGQTFATVDEVHPENIPTRNWPPGLYLRNQLQLEIPRNIPPIRYDVNVGVYNHETGQRLAIVPGQGTTFKLGSIWLESSQPDLADSVLAQFGPHINLQQVLFENGSLTLYWQTTAALDQDFSIFVHLLDDQGNWLGQADGVPYNDLYPLANWLPHQTITDQRSLNTLIQNNPDLSAIAIGVYNPSTGERLPAVDANGQALPDDSFVIPVTS